MTAHSRPAVMSRLVLAAVFVLTTVPLLSTEQAGPDPLIGVSKTGVLVSFAPTGAAPNGTSESRLQTIVELRLRQSGLRVLTNEEVLKDPDLIPWVQLAVMTLETKNQGGTIIGFTYSLSLAMRVYGTVPLSRAQRPMVLWETATIAVASREAASADIERIVGEQTDSLLNAWLKANPKR